MALSTTACSRSHIMLVSSKEDNLELGGSHLYSTQFLTPSFLDWTLNAYILYFACMVQLVFLNENIPQ